MAWYDTSWSYRVKVTIDNTKVADDLTIDVLLTESNFAASFFSNSKSDGSDIVVTEDDGTTKLYRDLIYFHQGDEEIRMRVNVDILAATDVDIYVYYGNGSASETVNQSGTYGSSIVGFWTLDESPSGAGSIIDRTGSFDGTPTGVTQNDPGKIGPGLLWDGGTGDEVNLGDIDIASNITMQLWAYLESRATDDNQGYKTLIRKSPPTHGDPYWMYTLSLDSANEKCDMGLSTGASASYESITSVDDFPLQTWTMVTGTYDGTTMRLYFGGTEQVNDTQFSGSIGTNSVVTYLGRLIHATYHRWHGMLDECRLTDSAMSAEEVTTRYNNENSPSTFYSVGAQDAVTSISSTLGTVDIAGYTSSVTTDVDVTASLGTVDIAGYTSSVTVDVDADVTATLGTIDIAGYTTSVDAGLGVVASLGSVTISGIQGYVDIAIVPDPNVITVLVEYDFLQESDSDTRKRCDVCSNVTEIKKLVRTQVRWLQPAGSNYLPYSSYDSSLWTCTGTSKGKIGYGPHGDEQRMQIYDDNSLAYARCSQTWRGAGTFRSHTTGIDVSALTNFAVSAHVAQVIRYLSNVGYASSFTVAAGLCDGDGNNKSPQKTYTSVSGLQNCWFGMNVSDIPAALSSSGIYVYFTVTPEQGEHEYWLVDDLSIEANKSKPTQFITTTGTAITAQTATKTMAMRKVCPRCREDLLRESEPPSSHEQRVEAPVSSAPQQV